MLFSDLDDYDHAAPAPVTGNGLGYWSGANGGTGGWQPTTFVNQEYQRAPIGGTAVVGDKTGTWAPDATASNEAVVNATGDLEIDLPTGATDNNDGQRYFAWITAKTASRTITLGTGIKRMAGIPSTGIQVPAEMVGLAVLHYRYSRDEWTCLALTTQEA